MGMNPRIPIFAALVLLVLEQSLTPDSFFKWIFAQTIFFTGIPLLSLFLFKIRPEEVGLSLKSWRVSVKYAAIVLVLAIPIMLYGASLSDFRAYYPLWPYAGDSVKNFMLYEAAIAILMFNTEFLFRGYLLFGLEREFGRKQAILLHAIPYMLVHIGKPPLEVPYSFFAGLLFGYMALKTRSILPSFLVHFLGSEGFEVMCL